MGLHQAAVKPCGGAAGGGDAGDARVLPQQAGDIIGDGIPDVLSAAPVMVQLASTSHRARPWESSRAVRPSLVLGSSSPYRAAMTGQKRFCGWA